MNSICFNIHPHVQGKIIPTECQCRDSQLSRSCQRGGPSRQRGLALPISPPSKISCVSQRVSPGKLLNNYYSVKANTIPTYQFVFEITSWWPELPSLPCTQATYYWIPLVCGLLMLLFLLLVSCY